MAKGRLTGFFQSKGLVLLLAFLLFILILSFFFGDRGIIEIIKTRRQIAQLEQSIRRLEAENERLSEEVRQLRDNPQALEKAAREKLWLMKKNEQVVVIAPAGEKSPNGKEGKSK